MSLPQGITVSYGDTVMMVGKDRKKFIFTVQKGEKFQTHLGEVAHDRMIDLEFGEKVRTHLGHSFYILAPSFDDVLSNIKRETQIIFPKDLGYIMLKLGIREGMQIIEAGTGSGALTTLLAFLVGKKGHVYSYDRREKAQRLAIKNIRAVNLESRVTFFERDIAEGFEQRYVHAVFLDVPDPENYLDVAHHAMRGGGFLGAIVPTVNQMMVLIEQLKQGAWFYVQAEELILRQWKTVPARMRPDDQMVGHTGFLVFARAVYREEEDEG